ncbi:hypothetical protein EUTSA_v10016945mg [Eutrema salsugineum]|uniref:F-box domain-containing protein n=1 Tax=Eutrema salsugineum TaxID=72664 RepID=V4LLY3_EUTSA|nr:hypothetical protein EUTSA_v10016945mg [Eutrema salsugineum]
MSYKITAKKTPSLSLITSLPEDVIIDILARVPRCDYPKISLVSKHFQSLVASPELYVRRSLLNCTEHCLYAVLFNYETKDSHLYILRRKPNCNRCLVLIPSLPVIPWGVSFVTVGSRIYVFGGNDKKYIEASIDCISHTKMMMVFNTETQMWEPEIIKMDTELISINCFYWVVMADKLFTRDLYNSFAYEPTKSKWKMDDMLNSKVWRSACVVDDVLYYYDGDENKIRAYDPKQKCWSVVKGLEKLLPETIDPWWSETVSYGGKLTLFFRKVEMQTSEIWCAEIALERRQGGEIWGKVEWCDHLLTGNFHLRKPLAVVV